MGAQAPSLVQRLTGSAGGVGHDCVRGCRGIAPGIKVPLSDDYASCTVSDVLYWAYTELLLVQI